jgi:uncharacterized protein (DUF302 family)
MNQSTVTQLAVERVAVVSDKSFASVLASIRGGVGQPAMKKLWDAIWAADTFAKVESVVKPVLGPTGLMQFAEFDDGGFIRKDRGEGTPQAMRLLIGNPLIMKQMTELVPDAAAYAPVTVLVDERAGKVHVSHDRMASLLAVYKNPAATKIAQELDAKIETLIRSAV